MASIQLQGVTKSEQIKENEQLRIQVEKTTGVEVGLRASLQVDFLKLLRFTLLSFDFSYELEHSYTTHLSFSTEELEEIEVDEELQRQIKNSFRYGHFDGRRYPHLVLATEESKKATMNSKYLLLLLGGIKDQATTHVEFKKDEMIHTFFKHYFEKTTFVQNFLSRFMSGVIKSLLGLGSSINNALSDVRRFELEYKSEENLLESKDKFKVTKENFSMTIDRSFDSGRLNKLTKKAAIEILESYGGVDPLVWVLQCAYCFNIAPMHARKCWGCRGNLETYSKPMQMPRSNFPKKEHPRNQRDERANAPQQPSQNPVGAPPPNAPKPWWAHRRQRDSVKSQESGAEASESESP